VHEIQTSLHALGFGNVASGSNFISGAAKLVASSTLDLLGALVVIVAVAFYFAIDPSLYLDGIVYLLPVWYRERGRMILLEAGAAVQGWLLGQLIDMLVVGFLVGGGLALLGVPLALVLGVIAGLFTFVPYFGTIISAVPALMVGLTGGPRQMLWVLALFVVAHGIEGYVVAPLVQRRTVHLPPALTLIAMVVLTAVIGISGVLIATPLVAVLLVGVTRVYVEDILGDHVGGARLTVRGWW
jgi:predicted PurR-regulated permease PerM